MDIKKLNILFSIIFFTTLVILGFWYALYMGLALLIIVIYINCENKKSLNLDYLNKQPFAYVVLDGFEIIKSDSKFKEIVDLNVNNIKEVIRDFDISKNQSDTFINGNHYNLYIQLINKGKKSKTKHTVVFFVPNNDIKGNYFEKDELVVSLIFIDNYEKLMNSIEKSSRPLLVALIDEKINDLENQSEGIVRKFNNDKYMFISFKKKLEIIKGKKFDILGKMSEIQIGNEFPVTISIGVGVDGGTLKRTMEHAVYAINLARSRGGNQVIVRNKKDYYFYSEPPKENKNVNMKSQYSISKIYALIDLIDKCSNVIVMGHRNADLDCFGASIGIYKIVNARGKPCNIVINKVMPSVKLLYEKFLEIDDNEKIFVTPSESNELVGDNTLLIVVDTHKVSMTDNQEIFKNIKKIVVLDHHKKGTDYIENVFLNYHDPFASSTCELVTEIIQFTGEINLESLLADALLAGITIDTKNFSLKTGHRTFETAAFLRKNGADSVRVKLLLQNDFETYRAKTIIVSNAEIIEDLIAISVIEEEVDNSKLIIALSADDLLTISGIKASFVLCKQDEVILISGRSIGNINVQVILEKLGGGGDRNSSGAEMFNVSIEEAREKLKLCIKEYMEVNV